LESNQPFGFFRPALIRLSYPTGLERAVRLELTNTGFAIQRLSHLATRAVGAEEEIRTLESSLEDSHVSSYITSACEREPGRPAFWWWGENSLHQIGASYRTRTGVSALATLCLEPTGPTMRNGRRGQSRTVATSSQDSDAHVTPHPELKLVRQVRLELTLPCLRGRCLDPILATDAWRN
jgi:hypothetical protein